MNIAMLAFTNLTLVNGITKDLFPAVETPIIDCGMVNCSRSEVEISVPAEN